MAAGLLSSVDEIVKLVVTVVSFLVSLVVAIIAKVQAGSAKKALKKTSANVCSPEVQLYIYKTVTDLIHGIFSSMEVKKDEKQATQVASSDEEKGRS